MQVGGDAPWRSTCITSMAYLFSLFFSSCMHGNLPHIFFDSKLMGAQKRKYATLFAFTRKPLFPMSLTKKNTHTYVQKRQTSKRKENGEAHFDFAIHLGKCLLSFPLLFFFVFFWTIPLRLSVSTHKTKNRARGGGRNKIQVLSIHWSADYPGGPRSFS